MRAMWRTTVQGVLARKVRLALTALSTSRSRRPESASTWSFDVLEAIAHE